MCISARKQAFLGHHWPAAGGGALPCHGCLMGFQLLQSGHSFGNHQSPLLHVCGHVRGPCSVVLRCKDVEAVYGKLTSLMLICVLLSNSVCLLCLQLLAPGTRLGIYVNSCMLPHMLPYHSQSGTGRMLWHYVISGLRKSVCAYVVRSLQREVHSQSCSGSRRT